MISVNMMQIYSFILIDDKNASLTEMRILSVNNSANVRSNEAETVLQSNFR